MRTHINRYKQSVMEICKSLLALLSDMLMTDGKKQSHKKGVKGRFRSAD